MNNKLTTRINKQSKIVKTKGNNCHHELMEKRNMGWILKLKIEMAELNKRGRNKNKDKYRKGKRSFVCFAK